MIALVLFSSIYEQQYLHNQVVTSEHNNISELFVQVMNYYYYNSFNQYATSSLK